MSESNEKVNRFKAERAFLACCLLDNHTIEFGKGLRSELFSDHRFGTVWAYVWRLWDTGKRVDAITLADAMLGGGVFDEVGGDALLWELVNSVPSGEEGRQYAVELIHDFAKASYGEYIVTNAWKEKAEAAKEAAGQRCQVCNTPRNQTILDTHHRTYERLGCEQPGDLIVLCRRCHRIFHENGSLAR
jgi:replicative DNA helicase